MAAVLPRHCVHCDSAFNNTALVSGRLPSPTGLGAVESVNWRVHRAVAVLQRRILLLLPALAWFGVSFWLQQLTL